MDVLYIGSGKSAELVHKIDTSKYTIVGVNNAWRLFKEKPFDTWIHSGDFPHEMRPKIKNHDREVSFREYNASAQRFTDKFGIASNSPPHYVGYTIFFLGLYWIMMDLQPTKISLLGFDHDFNTDKVKKWNNKGRPTPQNSFNKPKSQSLKEWYGEFFQGMEKDCFYGHGTPDPMRLGEPHLKSKFIQAADNSKKLGIELVNLSPVKSEINIIKKEVPRLPKHLGGHLWKTHIDTGTLSYIQSKYDVRTAIDLGCGPGGMVKEMEKTGIKAMGIDGDYTLNPDTNWRCHDFCSGPLRLDSEYDLCWTVEFLEHVDEKYIKKLFFRD